MSINTTVLENRIADLNKAMSRLAESVTSLFQICEAGFKVGRKYRLKEDVLLTGESFTKGDVVYAAGLTQRGGIVLFNERSQSDLPVSLTTLYGWVRCGALELLPEEE